MSTAITQSAGNLKTILASDKMQAQFAASLPKHLSPERFGRVAMTALSRTPKLAECTQESFFKCLLDLSAMGLEPDGRRAHLIPYGKECTLILDYKGIVELMRRSGNVVKIHADVVCENDSFEHNLGEITRHTFDLFGERGEVKGAYCQVTFKDGSVQSAIMSKAEIEGIRSRSRAGKSGPWVSDWNEMAKKTVVRRVSKMITLSPEIMDAVERSDRHEFGQMRTVSDFQPKIEDTATNLKALAQGGPVNEELTGESRLEDHPQAEPKEPRQEVPSDAGDREQATPTDDAPTPATKAYLESYKIKEGKTGNKPWSLHILTLLIKGETVEATTFDGKIGSLAEFNVDEWCLVDLIENKKGKMDVVAFLPLEGGAE